jgi:hypothetical protein
MNNHSFLQHLYKIGDWLPSWSGVLKPRQTEFLDIPTDLEVEPSGVCFVDGQDELDYLWYRLREAEGLKEYAGYRVVRLLQLTFLPFEARSDPGLLQKMRTVFEGCTGRESAFYILPLVSSTTTNPRWGSFNVMACLPFRIHSKRLAPNPGATWQRLKGP